MLTDLFIDKLWYFILLNIILIAVFYEKEIYLCWFQMQAEMRIAKESY